LSDEFGTNEGGGGGDILRYGICPVEQKTAKNHDRLPLDPESIPKHLE
jgi:hypothetical protein